MSESAGYNKPDTEIHSMEKENLIGKIENLNIKAFLTALTVLSAWIITGLVLTNSIDFELEYLVSGLSVAISIPLAYFWKDMDSPAGQTWRNVIGAGIFINLVAVGMFLLEAYGLRLIELAILYWVAVPGYGFMVNRNFMKTNSKTYMALAHTSSVVSIAFFVGTFQIINYLVIIATLGTGLIHGVGVYFSLESFLERDKE